MAASKKKPATKKSTATKKPSQARRTSKSSASRTQSTSAQSQFMQTRVTEQTIYWLIIGAAVIALAVWVLSLQRQLNDIYDQIQIDSSSNSYIKVKSERQ